MTTHYMRIGGKTYKVVLTDEGSATVDGSPYAIDVRQLQPGMLSLLHTDSAGQTRSYDCQAAESAVVMNGQVIAYTQADPRSLQATTATTASTGPTALKSPMPGRIVRVLVAAGDEVEQGQGCVVIEAMKMQNELKAPRAGTVTKLSAQAGETVGANAVLLVIG